MTFADIVQRGTSAPAQPYATHAQRMMGMPSNKIRCVDGFTFSAIAGWGCYSTPRPAMMFSDPWGTGDRLHMYDAPHDYAGPYTAVEIGFPSDRPEPWAQWEAWCESPEKPTGTVYARVPVEAVFALIELHGGEQVDELEMMWHGTENQ